MLTWIFKEGLLYFLLVGEGGGGGGGEGGGFGIDCWVCFEQWQLTFLRSWRENGKEKKRKKHKIEL